MIKQLKAISLWEPWASLIWCGSKTIETRSWAPKFRGELLICAAKAKHLSKTRHLYLLEPFLNALRPLRKKGYLYLNYGKAVAVVTLVDVQSTNHLPLSEYWKEKDFGDYSPSRYAWIFKNIRPIEKPFPVTGRQGFFNVDVTGKI